MNKIQPNYSIKLKNIYLLNVKFFIIFGFFSLTTSSISLAQDAPILYWGSGIEFTKFDVALEEETSIQHGINFIKDLDVDLINEFYIVSFYSSLKKYDFDYNVLETYWGTDLGHMKTDFQNEYIFFTQPFSPTYADLYRQAIDGSLLAGISGMNPDFGTFAVDPQNELVFFHPDGSTILHSCSYAGFNCTPTPVADIGAYNYKFMDVAPTEEYLFYVVGQDIRRINYNGTNSTTVYFGNSTIKGMVVDTLNNRLCWTKNSDVFTSDYDGQNITVFDAQTPIQNYLSLAYPSAPDDYLPKAPIASCVTDNVYLSKAGTGIVYGDLDGVCHRVSMDDTGVLISQPYDCPPSNKKYNVYWGDTGTNEVKRIDLTIKPAISIVNSIEINGLVADSENEEIYYINISTNAIEKSSLDGLSQSLIYTAGVNPIKNLAQNPDSNVLYYLENEDEIFAVDFDGTNQSSVLNNIGGTVDFEVDYINSEIYWLQGTDLKKANDDGSNIVSLFSLTTIDFDLDLINDKIYWLNSATNFIQKSDFDGSNVEDVLAVPANTMQVKVDAINSTVYWMEPSYKIFANSLSGGSDQTIAWLGQGTHMALDSPIGKFSDLNSTDLEGDFHITDPNKSIIFTSPNGNCWDTTVNPTGDLSITSTSCPTDLFGTPTLAIQYDANIFIDQYSDEPRFLFSAADANCYSIKVSSAGIILFGIDDCP